MPIPSPTTPETWASFGVVGLFFPLHIICGLLAIPFLCYQLYSGSVVALVFVIVYLPLYLYPAQLRYPGWKGFDLLWRLMDYSTTCPSYFGSFEVHNPHEVDGDAQYFAACHPHGTLIFQRMFWRSEQLRRHLRRDWRMLGASVIFRIPIMREMSLWFGAVDASRANCERLLRAGVTVTVWPGGLDEANSVDAPDSVNIRTRTGFVRLAVKHGVPVLPAFVFGELDAVSAVSPLPKAVADFCQKKLRFSTAMFLGRWNTFLPRRVPFHMVLGKPCPVQKLAPDEPGFDAEVERVHALYKAGILEIYETHRAKFGYEDRQLVFLEDKKSK